MSSIITSSLRAASRQTFTSTTRRFNSQSATSSTPLTSAIRSSIQRANAEAHDEAFKAGVVYTLLGVSALGAGYLVLAPKQGRTVMAGDLL